MEIEKSPMRVDQERQASPASTDQADSVTIKAKPKAAAKLEKPASGKIVRNDNSVMEITKFPIGTDQERKEFPHSNNQADSVTKKAKPKAAAKSDRPVSAETGKTDNSVREITKPPIWAGEEKQASSTSSDQTDFIMTKAKLKVSAILENPGSAGFLRSSGSRRIRSASPSIPFVVG